MRDEIVLATKYTSPYRMFNKSEIQANYVGNNAKSLKVSLEASLKNLKTHYIDLVCFFPNRAPVDWGFEMLILALAICPLVGLQYFHRGGDDLAQPARYCRQGSVSRSQRYTRLGRQPRKSMYIPFRPDSRFTH